jgi:hypothetical protein
MLAEISRRVSDLKRSEQARKDAEFIAGWERYLAQLTAKVGDLIHENAQKQVVDSRFTERGLEFQVWPGDAYFDHVLETTKMPPNALTAHAWATFVTGWANAGIKVSVCPDHDLVAIRFEPK